MTLMTMLMGVFFGCRVPRVIDSGSAEQPEGQSSTASECEVVGERDVSFAEDMGGYTANAALNTVQGTHIQTLNWTGGSTTGITVTLWGATTAIYRDSEPMAGEEGAGACLDHLAIPMSLRVMTNDGQINFESPVEVRVYGPGTVGFTISLDRTDILFDPRAWVEESFDTLRSELGAEWAGPSLRGQITAYGSQGLDTEGEAEGTEQIFVVAQF